MLFMLFHAFLSKKSTLFEKYRLLVTRNPLYFSYAFCAFCAFLDIFLGEHRIFGPLFCPFGPFLFHLWLFWSQFSPFWSLWSFSIHIWTYFLVHFWTFG